MTFGEKLKKLRKEKKISQRELAEKIGATTSMIGMYEQGRRNPKMNTIQTIAKALEVEPSYFLDIIEKNPSKRLAQNIKKYREKNNYTIEDFSEKSHIPIEKIKQLESGDSTEQISSIALFHIAKCLNVEIYQLLDHDILMELNTPEDIKAFCKYLDATGVKVIRNLGAEISNNEEIISLTYEITLNDGSHFLFNEETFSKLENSIKEYSEYKIKQIADEGKKFF